MTDAERIAHLKASLARVAAPEAFTCAQDDLDPETYARMVFASAILDDLTLEAAVAKASYETRRKFDLPDFDPRHTR